MNAEKLDNVLIALMDTFIILWTSSIFTTAGLGILYEFVSMFFSLPFDNVFAYTSIVIFAIGAFILFVVFISCAFLSCIWYLMNVWMYYNEK